MKAGIEIVTPEIAVKYLETNTKNFRNPDQKRVLRYAAEMKSGNWCMNGSTIVFDSDGCLLDGQHRLLGFLKSGLLHIQFLIVRGAASDATGIDRGLGRTVSQWVSHLGLPNANVTAAAARLILMHDKQIWTRQSIGADLYCDSEVVEICTKYATEINDSIYRPIVGMPASVSTAIAFLASGKHGGKKSKLVEWFFGALISGEDIGQDDAVFHLRARLIDSGAMSGKRMTTHMIRMLTTIAWNKTVSGESCSANGLRIRMTGPSPQKLPESVVAADDI